MNYERHMNDAQPLILKAHISTTCSGKLTKTITFLLHFFYFKIYKKLKYSKQQFKEIYLQQY